MISELRKSHIPIGQVQQFSSTNQETYNNSGSPDLKVRMEEQRQIQKKLKGPNLHFGLDKTDYTS
jgi:hypothetical protein